MWRKRLIPILIKKKPFSFFNIGVSFYLFEFFLEAIESTWSTIGVVLYWHMNRVRTRPLEMGERKGRGDKVRFFFTSNRIRNRRGAAGCFWSIEQEEEPKIKTTKSNDYQDTHSDSIFWSPIFGKPFFGASALHTEDWIAWITSIIYCVTITSYW